MEPVVLVCSCLQELEATVELRSLRLLPTTSVTAAHKSVCVDLAEYRIRVITLLSYLVSLSLLLCSECVWSVLS